MRATLILVVCTCVAALTNKEQVNPIRKITGLMENMQKEIADQQAKDQALYDNFMCFCDNGAADLLKTASDADAANKAAAAQLEADTAEKAQLEGDIKTHESDLAGATKDLEEATNIRDKSKAEFDATVATKSSSEAALGKAIPAIEKGMGGAALMEFVGDAAFKQIKRAIRSSQRVTGGNRESISSFLQGEAPGSGEILGMLKSMKDELSRDIAQLEKDEASAVAGFSDMKASKEKEIEFADESIESKKERVGTLAVEIVKNKDAVEDSAAEAAAAKKFAATLEKQCATKKKEFAEISKMRADETAAIGEAIGILTDDDALDVFKKSVPAAALVQAQPEVRSGFSGHRNMFTGEMSFLQAKKKPAQVLQKAMAIIAQAAGSNKMPNSGLMFMSLKSKMRLAQKATVEGAVDFSEIFKMIDEMIAILTKDNKDDAAQKDFCIAELTKTEAEKAATEDKLSSLASSIEETKDGIASAEEQIKSLQDGVAALDKDVAEATEQRKKEHEEFSETLKLSEVALQLIGKAKNRLQKFYNPTLYKAPPKKEMTMEEKIISAGSSALVQQEAAFDSGASFVQIRMLRTTSSKVAPPEAPAAPGPFKKSEKSGGVMALMDMIMGELKTSATESKMEEKYAQKDYVELMEDSKESRATDLKSLTEVESSKADLESTLTEAKENQMLTLEQSQNVISTLAKLHGSCDFIIKNFELRLNARTAEIEGLKTAKAVLAGANFS
jgi:septal ring factor EnvC (AmiA/AmiB activator)